MPTPEELAQRRIEQHRRPLGTYQPVFEGAELMGYRITGGPALGSEEARGVLSWSSARELLERSQYRMQETFGAGLPGPGSGWYRYPGIEGISKAWTEYVRENEEKFGAGSVARVIREGWGQETSEAADSLLSSLRVNSAGTNMFGLPVIDDTSASVLRFGYKQGEDFTEVNFEEALKFLQSKLGFQAEGGTKLMKRLKSLMSLRGLGNLELAKKGTTDTYFKVGVFGQENIEHFYNAIKDEAKYKGATEAVIRADATDMAKAAVEGTSMIRRSSVTHQINLLKEEAEKLRDSVAKGDMSLEAIGTRRRADDMLRKIGTENMPGSLRWQVAQGKVFGNARIMGLQVHDLDSGQKLDMQGQIKGDIRIIPDAVANRLAKGMKGIDVFTSKWNIKPELQFGGGLARFFSIEPHAPHEVFLDVQSMASFPSLFDPVRLQAVMEDDFKKFMAGTSGDFTRAKGGLLRMADELENRMGDLMPEEGTVERAAFERAKGYVSQFRDLVNQGIDPRDRPDVMMGMVNSYRAHLTKTKKGVLTPRFRLPDTKAAGAVLAHDMPGWDVAEGAVAYNAKQGTWVFHQRTWQDLLQSFGGSDLDDTMVNMLRMDENNKLRAVMFRQPNALTEFAVLNVDPGDSFVAEMLRKKGVTDLGQYTEANKAARKAQSEIRRIDGELKQLQSLVSGKKTGFGALQSRVESLGIEIERLAGLVNADNRSGAPRATLNERELWKARRRELGKAQQELEKARQAVERAQALGGELTSARARHVEATGNVASWVETHQNQFERINLGELQKRGVLKQMEGRNFYVGHDPRVNYLKVAADKKDIESNVFTAGSIIKRLKNYVTNRGALGKYSNFRMVMDSWLNTVPIDLQQDGVKGKIDQLISEKDGLKYYGTYNLLEHEKAIDASTQAAGIVVEAPVGSGLAEVGELVGGNMRRVKLEDIQKHGIEQMVNDLTVRRAALGHGSGGLDPWMVENRLKRSGHYEHAIATFDKLREQHGFDFGFEQLFMKEDDPRAIAQQLANRQKESLKRMFGDVLFDEHTGQVKHDAPLSGAALEDIRGRGFSDLLTGRLEAEQYAQSGQDLLKTYHESRGRHAIDSEVLKLPEHLAGSLGDLGNTDWDAVHADMLESLLPHLEKNAKGESVVGQDVYNRIYAMMRIIEQKGHGYRALSPSGGGVTFGDIVNRAHVSALLQDWQARNAETYAYPLEPKEAERVAGWRDFLAKDITETDIRGSAIEKRATLGLAAARNQMKAAEDAADTAKGPFKKMADLYERFSPEILKELSTKSGKRVLAGVGIMGALGVLKAVRDRDHTFQDIKGPPNLPGGNPYEGPMPRPFELDSSYANGAPQGVVFDVNARGSFNGGKFAQQAQFVSGASSVGGGMHDGRTLDSPDKQRQRLLSRIG